MAIQDRKPTVGIPVHTWCGEIPALAPAPGFLLALFALVLYPFVWLVLPPFEIVGIAVLGVLALKGLLFLPARVRTGPGRV